MCRKRPSKNARMAHPDPIQNGFAAGVPLRSASRHGCLRWLRGHGGEGGVGSSGGGGQRCRGGGRAAGRGLGGWWAAIRWGPDAALRVGNAVWSCCWRGEVRRDAWGLGGGVERRLVARRVGLEERDSCRGCVSIRFVFQEQSCAPCLLCPVFSTHAPLSAVSTSFVGRGVSGRYSAQNT